MELERCTVRPWRLEDAAAIQRHADNRKIWINLRDGFPSPYTVDDARRFIASAMAERSPTRFAIVVNGEAAGGAGRTGGAQPLIVSGSGGKQGSWAA